MNGNKLRQAEHTVGEQVVYTVDDLKTYYQLGFQVHQNVDLFGIKRQFQENVFPHRIASMPLSMTDPAKEEFRQEVSGTQ